MCKDERKSTSTWFKYKKESPKKEQDYFEDRKLRAISKSIDVSKLDKRAALPVDEFGRVEIDPSRPNYKYWTEDD
jgi:hypothetical protein